MSEKYTDDQRRRIYSYATIQSDPKGQFTQLVKHIEQLPDYDAHLKKVADSKDYRERISYVSNVFLRCIELVPVFKKKDDKGAEEARTEGNEWFQKKKFKEALLRYNRSVLLAKDEDILVLAVANRSACSFHLKAYDDSVVDVQFALAHGFPAQKRLKLYLRLAKSYIKTGMGHKVQAVLQVAKSLQTKEDIASGTSKEISDIEKELAESAKSAPKKAEEQDKKKTSSLDGLSDSLAVSCSAGSGRFVVASKEIGVGEVVLEEEAFASALYPERSGQNCLVCLASLCNSIVFPCPDCSGVAFCSVRCRDLGTESFHRHECKFADVLFGFGCSQIARLALRMVAQQSFQHLWEMRQELRSAAGKKNVMNASRHKYAQVLSLVDNDDQRCSEDHLRRALMAGILLKVLKESGFFVSAGVEIGQELYIGSLLLRNLEVLQFNAHEVYEVLRSNRQSLKPCKNRAVALAVYPQASMFNHSCFGAVARTFHGSRMVLRSLRKIKVGDEVHDNYGPTFYFKGRQERRRELAARYWFECRCKACNEDWPLLDRLPKKNKKADETTMLEMAVREMDKGKTEEAMEHLVGFLEKTCATSESLPPAEEVVRAEDKLRTCVSNLGNVVFVQN